jgi:3-hydroxyacyl-CoA dehydrogenase/enoyl-CoA hydratase/3-hydroxybutyryl-CoA epimerase
MQLVEVVSGAATDRQAAARGAGFTRAIDRLPLPVRSSPGFLVNRVLMPYLMEAVHPVEEGVPAPVVDRAAKAFGMPVGPVEFADTIGLDVCLAVAEKMADQLGDTVPARLRQLVAAKHLGRKSGRGFYRYRGDRIVKDALRPAHRSPKDLTERLIFRLLNEAVACLREGVVADPDLLDAGVVFGTGFAPFRGGPMHYIEQGGLTEMRKRLDALHRDHGDHFSPDSGWTELGRA